MSDTTRQELEETLKNYESQLNDDTFFRLSFEERLELADKLHNIKMKLNGVKPESSYIDCVGCGS
tara:strand:+ start:1122 stop:1316 length:195 start_codon:yes stop_codon:yes gene_type:complete